jgi:hypothetical protein
MEPTDNGPWIGSSLVKILRAPAARVAMARTAGRCPKTIELAFAEIFAWIERIEILTKMLNLRVILGVCGDRDWPMINSRQLAFHASRFYRLDQGRACAASTTEEIRSLHNSGGARLCRKADGAV